MASRDGTDSQRTTTNRRIFQSSMQPTSTRTIITYNAYFVALLVPLVLFLRLDTAIVAPYKCEETRPTTMSVKCILRQFDEQCYTLSSSVFASFTNCSVAPDSNVKTVDSQVREVVEPRVATVDSAPVATVNEGSGQMTELAVLQDLVEPPIVNVSSEHGIAARISETNSSDVTFIRPRSRRSTATPDFERASGFIKLTQLLAMLASSLGFLINGTIMDYFGRCRMAIVNSLAMLLVTIPCMCVANRTCFLIFNTLRIYFTSGTLISLIVLAVEMNAVRVRMLVLAVVYGVSYFAVDILEGLFIAVSSWQLLMLAIYIPLLMCLLIYKALEESPRWLILEGRREDALDVFRKLGATSYQEQPHRALLLDQISTLKSGSRVDHALLDMQPDSIEQLVSRRLYKGLQDQQKFLGLEAKPKCKRFVSIFSSMISIVILVIAFNVISRQCPAPIPQNSTQNLLKILALVVITALYLLLAGLLRSRVKFCICVIVLFDALFVVQLVSTLMGVPIAGLRPLIDISHLWIVFGYTMWFVEFIQTRSRGFYTACLFTACGTSYYTVQLLASQDTTVTQKDGWYCMIALFATTCLAVISLLFVPDLEGRLHDTKMEQNNALETLEYSFLKNLILPSKAKGPTVLFPPQN